jgi:dihydrofolate synthase / folylpolyglutamate synthase
MNYKETLQFLYAQLPMFSKQGAAAYKPNLNNTIALCNAINNPQQHLKCIHIAGTNGKGSTSHMLAAILQQNGYRTGLYTSPHLIDFRERIKVNGNFCSQQFVVDFTQSILPIIYQIKPSFFEVTVAMAFAYFEQQKVDVAVIETGLGGRLDSTNIINPLLSIITNIGLDHTNLLGNSLEKIAFEKAGIIKSKTPVIIGETLPQTLPVFLDKAKQEKVTILLAKDAFEVVNYHQTANNLQISVLDVQEKKANKYLLDLNGIYQTKNILSVLLSVKLLSNLGFVFTQKNIEFALANSKKINGLMGRWQTITTEPLTIADVAHNKDGIEQLLLQIEQMTFNNLHIVLGMVKDKDIEAVVSILPKKATYYFTNAAIERALPAGELQKIANHYFLNGLVFENVNIAIDAAKMQSHSNDLIIVCGSIFLVGEIENIEKM